MAEVSVEFGATDVGLEKTLKKLQDEMSALEQKTKSGELSTKELFDTMKQYKDVEKLSNSIKGIGDKSTEAKPKVDELSAGVKKAGNDAKETGDKAEVGFGKIAIGAGIAGAAAKAGMIVMDTAFAAVRKTVESFGQALDMGDRLDELSSRTGVTAGKLLVLERAFTNTGMAAEDVGPLINKMQKALVDAEDGTSAAAIAFAKLGLPLSQLKAMSPDEQFQAIGEAIARIPDPAERASASMEIFGRSGGKLNTLFANMSGEIKTATEQLGILPSIMDKNAAGYGAIADNIKVLRGKFVEFAAGLLDKVKPAVEAITEALTRFDAAKFGQDLAQAILGGTQAMKGFEGAIKAIKAGDLSTAFELIFTSIKVQLKETGNHIYATFKASFDSVVGYIKEIFNPSGAIFKTIEDSFEMVGLRIASNLQRNLAEALSGSVLTQGIAENLNKAANESNIAANKIEDNLKGAGERIAAQLEKAGKAFPETFDKSYNETKPLFDVQEDIKKVDELTQQATGSTEELTDAQVEAQKEAEGYYQEYQKWRAEQEKAVAAEQSAIDKRTASQKQELELKKQSLQYDLQLAEAKKSGNKDLESALNYQSAYNKNLEEAKKLMPVKEAEEFAKRMTDATTPVRTIGDQLKDIAQQKIDNPVLSMRQQTKLVEQDLKDLKSYLGDDFSKYDMPTIAQKLGLDTFRKSSAEVLESVKNKVKEIKDTPIDIKGTIDKASIDQSLADLKIQTENTFNGGDANAQGGDGGSGGSGGEGGQGGAFDGSKMFSIETCINAIMDGVDEIKRIGYKIEPKLPVAALVA